MSTLLSLQHQFQDYLLKDQRDIYPSIVPTEKVPVDTRLSIYLDAYRYRLIDALENNFPILSAYLGCDAFCKLSREYINKFPSAYRSIRWYGDRFAEYIKENCEAYLGELAEFEWKMTLAFDAAGEGTLQVEQMAAISPESWPNLSFIPQSSLQLIDFKWNIVELWEALSNEQTPPPVQQTPSIAWAIWRRDYINRFYALAEDEAWALKALVQGTSFGELCEGLCQWFKEEEVGVRAASLLKGWIESGMIGSVRNNNER